MGIVRAISHRKSNSAESPARMYDSPPPSAVRYTLPRLRVRINKPVTTDLRINDIVDRMTASEKFATIESSGETIRCRARDVQSDAFYILTRTDAGLIVRFETPDRWLSESVESDLYNSSDSLEELLEESLDELEWPIDEIPVTTFRHFRSDDLLYTFENDVPTGDDATEVGGTWLLAYEATFRELGDVAGETEDA